MSASLTVSFVVIVIVLWLSGRRWRVKQPYYPTSIEVCQKAGAKVAIVLYDGANNSARHHFTPLRETIEARGDVYSVEYSTKRCFADKIVTEAIDRVLHKQYEVILLHGGSMGAILALKSVLELRRRGYHGRICIALADGALCASMLQPMFMKLARLAPHLSPGPCWNLLSKVITKIAFRGVARKEQESDADQKQFKAHVKAMQAFRFSAIFDMLAIIQAAEAFDRNDFHGIDAVCLISQNDGVVRSDLFHKEFDRLFSSPERVALCLVIEYGMHLTYTEHPQRWVEAHKRALEVLLGNK